MVTLAEIHKVAIALVESEDEKARKTKISRASRYTREIKLTLQELQNGKTELTFLSNENDRQRMSRTIEALSQLGYECGKPESQAPTVSCKDSVHAICVPVWPKEIGLNG